jgi:Timeless protein
MSSKVSSGPGGGVSRTAGAQPSATTASASSTKATTVSPPTAAASAAAGGTGGKKKKKTSRSLLAAADVELFADDRRFQVDKKIVDELLLVCGVIGTTVSNSNDGSGVTSIVPVTDCLNWLQDLQRALRRDDDTFRPISLLLGQWNVVVQKLLPLVHSSCRYDTPMLLTIVKILVILTKPLSDNTVRAGKMVINVKSKKSTDAYVTVSVAVHAM